MAIKTSALPSEMLPREKLREQGLESLADDELLAIILSTGTSRHSVLELARLILAEQGEDGLAGLSRLGLEELKRLHGIGEAKATKLIAAIELGKRACRPKKGEIIATSQEAADFFRHRFSALDLTQENLLVLSLDARRRPLGCRRIARGTATQTLASPRDILREVIRAAATGFMIAHNHPSGDAAPSADDLALTRRLAAAAQCVGTTLYDHLIIGGGNFVSLADENMLK